MSGDGSFFTLGGTISPATARRLEALSEEEADRELRKLVIRINGTPSMRMKQGGRKRMLQAGNVTTTVVTPDTLELNGW